MCVRMLSVTTQTLQHTRNIAQITTFHADSSAESMPLDMMVKRTMRRFWQSSSAWSTLSAPSQPSSVDASPIVIRALATLMTHWQYHKITIKCCIAPPMTVPNGSKVGKVPIVNSTLSQLCDPRTRCSSLFIRPWAGSELQTQLSYMGGRPHFSHILPLPSRWFFCHVTAR